MHLLRDPFALAVSGYLYNRRGTEHSNFSPDHPMMRFLRREGAGRRGVTQPLCQVVDDAADARVGFSSSSHS